jgi:hypothetical protein
MSSSPTTTQRALAPPSVRAHAWVIWPLAAVLLLSLLSATVGLIEARNVRLQIAILQITPPGVLNSEAHHDRLETLGTVRRDHLVEAASQSVGSLLLATSLVAYLRQIKAVRAFACSDV